MVTNRKIYKPLILNIFMTLITDNYFENRKSKVLDERTKGNVELELLVKVVDHSITETGKSVLNHSLNNPSISLNVV